MERGGGRVAVGENCFMGDCSGCAFAGRSGTRGSGCGGTYSELARSGGLTVDDGRAVPGVDRLLSRIWAWEPAAL